VCPSEHADASCRPSLRVLYASTNISHPFTVGRVEMMEREGIEVECIGYERGDPPVRPAEQYDVLGHLRKGAYLSRVPSILRDVLALRRAIRRNDLIYVNGADMALVVHVAGMLLGRPVVRDVPDIERVLVMPGLKSRPLRRLDKLLEGRCKLLVLTSPAAETYYRDWIHVRTPVFVLENKVEPNVAEAWRRSLDELGSCSASQDAPVVDRPLRVGWFAQLRDQWSLDLVEHLATDFSERFEIVMAGIVGPRIHGFDQFLARNPTVRYLGPFRQIEDLPQLYSSVDISVACVLPELPTSLALSNRFYTSCYFGTPLIVRADTAAGDKVRHHDVGLVLRSSSPRDAAAELASTPLADWLRWKANMQALAPDVYCHTWESPELAERLRALRAV